jgi:hypothetical protein
VQKGCSKFLYFRRPSYEIFPFHFSKKHFLFFQSKEGHIFFGKISCFACCFRLKNRQFGVDFGCKSGCKPLPEPISALPGYLCKLPGYLCNYRGTFGQLPGYLWPFLAKNRGTFGKEPGYLWQRTGVPLALFCQLPGYLWPLPGYLLTTSGVPFGDFRGTFRLLPGYLLQRTGVPLAKIRICHEIFGQRYPGNLSFNAVLLLFPHVRSR